MSKRKTVTGEVLHDIRNAYDSILKTTSLKSRVLSQQLTWANAEDNPYFMLIFGKLAELQFMYAEAEKKMAQNYLEVSKAFKNIFQEEMILEEMKREQHNYQNKVTKIQKQLEAARKRGDVSKLQGLDTEAAAQAKLYTQLSLSVEAKAKKLELYKVKLVKSGLKRQAEGVLALSNQTQQLYAAQIELLDTLPDDLPSGEDVEAEKQDLEQRMSAVVSNLSILLGIVPPPHGGVSLRNSANTNSSSSPSVNRQSLIDSFSFFSGKKDNPKADRGMRHCSLSADKIDQVTAFERRVAPNNDIPPSPTSDTPPDSDSPPPLPHKGSVYCEIVIPGVHTKDRPILAKSKSESSVLRTGEDQNTIMSTRFDRRLEEAGLLKHSDEGTQQLSTPSSSTEDIMRNSEDPGYARLAILPTGPVVVKKKEKVLELVEEEGGYANPADAIKINPRVQHINQQQFSNSPSPPSSPVVPPERPPKSPISRTSGYESVDEIRKMREKQLKEKDEKRENATPSSWNQNAEVTGHKFDDNPGYSRPFGSITGHKILTTSEKPPPTSLPWQRTGSNGKKKEPSAKLFHLVGASSPVGAGRGSPELAGTGPEDYISPVVRSASTSAKVALKSGGVGRLHIEVPPSSLVGSKSGNQTVIADRQTTKVNRFILDVEESRNGEPEDDKPLRGEMGRSQSVGSALSSSTQTPAKITKLRTGHVRVIAGKTAGTVKSSKTDKQ